MTDGEPGEGSFEAFVQQQAGRLLGYARALTVHPDDAWDLVQEALTRVGERWDRSSLDDPAAYTRTIMVRLNIDRVRRLRRELDLLRRSNRPVDATTDPDRSGLDRWLLEALAELSPHQRTALALRHVEDLDVAAIAARMGCSAGTVRSHLSRGLQRLRAAAPARPSGMVPSDPHATEALS